ncbi:MAG TPA: hypothetical protein PKD85_00190 [Saprospiraceae bacterium]|nr:hypothetical protein [Saprospiraceae bacterium]
MFEIKSNIEVIGEVLYNHYAFQFIMIGFLLFVSMIVVISFVIRKQKKARAQILFKQLEAENEKLMFVK